MKKIGIALLGLGTVGSGTYKIITSRAESIARDYGVEIEIRHILEKDMKKVAALGIDPSIVSCDINNILKDSKIKIVAEFFGGIEPARTFLLSCLKQGKSIVTANKELFSKHWSEFESEAAQTGAGLYFEASCVGGVPIIRALQDSCQGNDILAIKGIVNGTTNYILTEMSENGSEYASTLAEAQHLGYAEANPSADVDGYDSCYKLSILSTLAYGKKVPINKIYREGITSISSEDIKFGEEFGLTIKLLAISKNNGDTIEAHVYPAFISNSHPLSKVGGAFNAVYVQGNNVGELMFYGKGAGELPTGSAIVSDIVYAAMASQHRRYPYVLDDNISYHFNSNFYSEYFVRMKVKDETGVLAEITNIFGKMNISIVTMLQKSSKMNIATLVFITQQTSEANMKQAVALIKNLDRVVEVSCVIRVEK